MAVKIGMLLFVCMLLVVVTSCFDTEGFNVTYYFQRKTNDWVYHPLRICTLVCNKGTTKCLINQANFKAWYLWFYDGIERTFTEWIVRYPMFYNKRQTVRKHRRILRIVEPRFICTAVRNGVCGSGAVCVD